MSTMNAVWFVRTGGWLIASVALLACMISSPGQARTSSETLAALRAQTETEPAPSALKRVNACLGLLREELASPSVPSFGIGGGPIDSGYIQEVIMGSVCTPAQKGAVREQIRAILAAKLTATPESEQAWRDRLVIMLGFAGDASVTGQLISLMQNHPDGFMRYGAVMALRDAPLSEEVIAAFERALSTDVFARVRFSDSLREWDPRTMVYSPARRIAAEVLRRAGRSIAQDADVIDATYGLQRLNALLYDSVADVACKHATLGVIGDIGGAEAEAVLQTFIARNAAVPEAADLVAEAHAVLDRLRSAP